MMFFVYHLQTYSPKNQAWKKVVEYVEKYEYVLIKNELSLDALKDELLNVIDRINAEHTKIKRIKYTACPICKGRAIRIEAYVMRDVWKDTVFILDICKVRSIYQFNEQTNVLVQEGGAQ